MHVELRPAYCWDCPDCGRENFVRGLVPELSSEDLEEMRNEHGIEPWDAGDFVAMPEIVKCIHCHIQFETEHFNDA